LFEDYRGWILCLWILNIGLLLQFLFRSREVDFFNPVVLFTLVNIRFLIRPIYWVITGDFDIWGGYMDKEETARYTIFGLLLNLAGVISYLLGYYSKASSLFLRKITVLSDVWYRRRFVVLVAACYAIAAAAFLVLVEGAGGLSVMMSNIARRREMFEGTYYLFVAVNLAVISFYVHAGRRLNLTRHLDGSNLLLLLVIALSFILFGGRGQILSIVAIFIMI
jgi:hypothetical protein